MVSKHGCVCRTEQQGGTQTLTFKALLASQKQRYIQNMETKTCHLKWMSYPFTQLFGDAGTVPILVKSETIKREGERRQTHEQVEPETQVQAWVLRCRAKC